MLCILCACLDFACVEYLKSDCVRVWMFHACGCACALYDVRVCLDVECVVHFMNVRGCVWTLYVLCMLCAFAWISVRCIFHE